MHSLAAQAEQQSEVQWTCHRVWLGSIWFMSYAEKEMQIELASSIEEPPTWNEPRLCKPLLRCG